MPILAVDQFGQLYETSPDRADGKGYKSHATPSARGDLTLGETYLRAEKQYQQQLVRDRRIQAILDQQEEAKLRRLNAEKVKLRNRQDAHEALNDNQDYQEKRRIQAYYSSQLGCNCDSSYALSGNGLTANGQLGWKGMDRDQQVIHQHMTKTQAHPVDPSEAMQHQARARAHVILNQLGKLEQQARIQEGQSDRQKLQAQRRQVRSFHGPLMGRQRHPAQRY